jgi:7-cyano-7-deazaguanine synthase
MRCLLLSGGVDSIALCYWLKPEFALTINYGQAAAEAEISAAAQVSRALSIEHIQVEIDCSAVGLGTMLECGRPSTALMVDPPTPEWWPFRNQLLVTIAAAKCVTLGITTIVIGTVRSDSVHGDGTPEFISALNGLLECQEGGMSLEAPAAQLSSLELISQSQVPMSLLGWSHSCHRSNVPCGTCRGCVKYRLIWSSLMDDRTEA